MKGDWWGTEVQLTREFLQRLKVSLGGEYRDNLRQSQRNYDSNPHLVYLDKEKSSALYGAFLQGDLKILENLRLNAGIRYDYYTIYRPGDGSGGRPHGLPERG